MCSTVRLPLPVVSLLGRSNLQRVLQAVRPRLYASKPEDPVRGAAYAVVTHKYTDSGIMGCIIVNTLLMAMEHQGQSATYVLSCNVKDPVSHPRPPRGRHGTLRLPCHILARASRAPLLHAFAVMCNMETDEAVSSLSLSVSDGDAVLKRRACG